MSFDYSPYKIHPVCGLFPEMSEKEYEDLSASIIDFGLQHPIVLDGDTILDGRHRFRVCIQQDIEPKFQQFSEILAKADVPEQTTPSSWIIATNLKRRSLTEDQKAAIAVRWYDIHQEEASKRKKAAFDPKKVAEARWNADRPKSDEQHERDHKKENASRASAVTAAAAGVSRYKVEKVKKIKDASEDLYNEVLRGDKTAIEAEKILDPDRPKKAKPIRVIDAEAAVVELDSDLEPVHPEPAGNPPPDLPREEQPGALERAKSRGKESKAYTAEYLGRLARKHGTSPMEEQLRLYLGGEDGQRERAETLELQEVLEWCADKAERLAAEVTSMASDQWRPAICYRIATLLQQRGDKFRDAIGYAPGEPVQEPDAER